MYSSFNSEEERKEQLRKVFILCGDLLILRRRARQKRWRHLSFKLCYDCDEWCSGRDSTPGHELSPICVERLECLT